MDKDSLEAELSEIEEAQKRMERDLQRMHESMKRVRQIFRLIFSLVFIILATSVISIVLPATKRYMDTTCGMASIGISIINYFQFLEALTWDKRMAVVMIIVMTINIGFGVAKFI